jgi:hypothetical protein
MGITPAGVTQEISRCLNMVRVAATRRCNRGCESSTDKRRAGEGSGRTAKVG